MTAEARAPLRHGLHRMASRGLERTMLVGGAVLLGVVAAELAVAVVLDPGVGWAIVRAVAVEMAAGREGAIPIALQGGAPRWLVAQVSATQDIGVFALAYPLFLRLMHRHADSRSWLMVRLRRIQKDAEGHRRFVQRLGGLGVFLFMLVPFLVNGPLVGGIAGRLAGMHSKDLLLPVVASTVVAAVAWTYFYDAMLGVAGDLHPALPYVLTAVVLALVLGPLLLRETLELRRERRRRREG